MSFLKRTTYEEEFTVIGSKGEVITKGSLDDCQSFIKLEEITGEMLKEGQDFGYTKVNGEKYYTVIPTGQRKVEKIDICSVVLIATVGWILSDCLISYIKNRKKVKKEG